MHIDVLIVAEKDSVARAIAKYLAQSGISARRIYGVKTYFFQRKGRNWASMGLKGHVMDVDFTPDLNDWHKVDPRTLLEVDPVLVIRSECLPYVKALAYLGSKAKEVYLALDADAEGEAIAYEAYMIIKLRNAHARFYRVRFSAVTKGEILKAFTQPDALAPSIARRVFTRMMLDLTLGAVFTRALTLTVEKYDKNALPPGKFLSYGPCQTPVLNLVVQRAIERENFKPERYYVVYASFDVNGMQITLTLDKMLKSIEEARKIVEAIKTIGRGRVVQAVYKEELQSPPIPLDTVELERRASKFLNIRPKQALDMAEELYRHGYISYPRTETTIYPPTLDLREILDELKDSEYASYVRKLASRPIKPTKGDSDDGAHPPIYPTKGATRYEILRKFRNEKFWKIYDFIVRHFLATLSPPAKFEVQRIAVTIGPYKFTTEGLKIIDLGYLEIYPFEKPHERVLPRVKMGDELRLVKAWFKECETEPPPYMTESELLRLMRKYGIGTDATMQDHIHTNVVRGYFRIKNRQCIPTPLGKAVIGVLSKVGPELIDPLFRARMERSLMEITRGKITPLEVLKTFKEEARRIYEKLLSNQGEIAFELIQALKRLKEAKRGV